MEKFLNECKSTIHEVQELLVTNREHWVRRFSNYANDIHRNEEEIRNKKKKTFNEWAPLYLYMNVSQAKGNMEFGLRYLGQQVATLKAKDGKTTISTKLFDDNNKRDFGCDIKLTSDEWRSTNASVFRKHFAGKLPRTLESKKRNEEHRVESALLTEFSKKSSTDKELCNIQPVKIAKIARFQMPTPISASNPKKLTYGTGLGLGGGIDILCRVGSAGRPHLCIMEVKDEYKANEPPRMAIKQALVYATFIRELLRSEDCEKWWHIFGFKKPRKQIKLLVACVMPAPANDDPDISFGNITIPFDVDSTDCAVLHYMYINECDNKIKVVSTSLGQKVI